MTPLNYPPSKTHCCGARFSTIKVYMASYSQFCAKIPRFSLSWQQDNKNCISSIPSRCLDEAAGPWTQRIQPFSVADQLYFDQPMPGEFRSSRQVQASHSPRWNWGNRTECHREALCWHRSQVTDFYTDPLQLHTSALSTNINNCTIYDYSFYSTSKLSWKVRITDKKRLTTN